MGISFLKDLPEFEKDYIVISSGPVSVGTVVVRPLDIFGGTTIEYHYGIVLGTSIDGRELILEMTKERNVNVVTKSKFLAPFAFEELQVHAPAPQLTRDQIIERAKKYQFHDYDFLDLNCKDFALYCAFLLEPPKRWQDVLRAKIELNDVANNYWRFMAEATSDERMKTYAKKALSESESNKEELEARLVAKENKL